MSEPKYNHAYDFAFEVISDKEDASDVTPAMLRQACIARAQSMDDEELMQCCDRFDTREE